jgi:hypothetical protein
MMGLARVLIFIRLVRKVPANPRPALLHFVCRLDKAQRAQQQASTQ